LIEHAWASGLIPDREVYFPGHVEDRDLAALYSASELFVFPSRYEGFGLPPLEAMACGVPVVLARNSSLVEVFDGTCTMFEGSDPTAIADAIRMALADESQRVECSRRGFELACGRSWDRVCAETLAVYERAVLGRIDSSNGHGDR
jgi:alpha-1,3-rhamnosyl/mannosyltransferase